MIRVRTQIVILLSCLGISTGCAMDGTKLPFRDSIASRWNNRKAESAGELSPEFREAQKVFKKDPEGTLLAWARWQEDVGEYGESRKKYRELLVAYPDNIEAQLGLARIELSCGRTQQAEEILTSVAKERPTNAPVRLELGRLYSQQENWSKAIAAFEEASAINTEDQVCRYELGVAFARSHRFDQALSHLTYAVGSSGANYNIGYVLHEQGNDAEASEWFQNAMNAHPDAKTAQKAQAMLAKMPHNNSQNRNSTPSYQSDSSAMSVVAAQSRQSAIDRFQPASFQDPVNQSPATGRFPEIAQSGVQLAVANQPAAQYSGQSTMLPPVDLQPAQFGMASASTKRLPNGNAASPFQTVSHAVPQGPATQTTGTSNQPPSWHPTKSPAVQTQNADASPAQWRGR